MLLSFIVDGIDEMNQKHLMSNFDLLRRCILSSVLWLEVHPDTIINASLLRLVQLECPCGSSTEEETYATIDDEILQNEINEFNFDSDGVRIILFDCPIGMGGPNLKLYQTAEKR